MKSDQKLHNDQTRSQLASPQQVRSCISITNSELLQLAHEQAKLQKRIRTLNRDGIIHIHKGNYTLALPFFNQCEKILEYAASCGRTLDRSLIIGVLHNQAVVHQYNGATDKASRYVEAIIYNLRMFLDAPENKAIQSALERRSASSASFTSFQPDLSLIRVMLTKKYELAVYYLQFSGLNSQNQMHRESLQNARKSLSIMTELSRLCYICQPFLPKGTISSRTLLSELGGLAHQWSQIQLKGLRLEFQRLQKADIDNNHVYTEMIQSLPQEVKQEIQDIDVHSIFDLTPKQMPITGQIVQQQGNSLEICSSYKLHLMKIVFLMGAYFAVAVQTQQISNIEHQIYQSTIEFQVSENKRDKKIQNISAQIALLMAIILGLKYLPAKSKLTNYLLQLYHESYHNIEKNQYQSNENDNLHINIIQEKKAMQDNMVQLRQKYKNYIVQKQTSIDVSEQNQSIEVAKDEKGEQQMKESKKLNKLLKPQPPVDTLKVPGQYLNEIQYIDSFEMANSQSNTKISPYSDQLKSIKTQPLQFQSNNIKNSGKLRVARQIKGCSSEIIEPNEEQNKKKTDKKDKKDSFQRGQLYINTIKLSKSKSTKHIKSKSKQIVFSKNLNKLQTQRSIPSLPLMTSCTDRNQKFVKNNKSPSKNSKNVNSNHKSPQLIKIISSEKKIMGNSETIKITRVISPPSTSKDNLCSIKFNKIKSPSKVEKPSHLEFKNKRPSKIQLNSIAKSKIKNCLVYNKNSISKNIGSKSKSINAKQHSKGEKIQGNCKIYTSAITAQLKKK